MISILLIIGITRIPIILIIIEIQIIKILLIIANIEIALNIQPRLRQVLACMALHRGLKPSEHFHGDGQQQSMLEQGLGEFLVE